RLPVSGESFPAFLTRKLLFHTLRLQRRRDLHILCQITEFLHRILFPLLIVFLFPIVHIHPPPRINRLYPVLLPVPESCASSQAPCSFWSALWLDLHPEKQRSPCFYNLRTQRTPRSDVPHHPA